MIKRKLRRGQGGGKGGKRVSYPGSQVKNVFQNRESGQLCQKLPIDD